MGEIYRFSAPGRTEISGNHTDHQHGCVLAAAVNLETTAQVTLNGSNVIRVFSEGYAPVEIDLKDLSIHENEKNTTAALVRGVAAAAAMCCLFVLRAAYKSNHKGGQMAAFSIGRENDDQYLSCISGTLRPAHRPDRTL